MKSPNGPLILAIFSVLILALCWVAVTAVTTPTRAIASGVASALFAGVFIWFAQTNRHAVARGLIALGATALAAPFAAIEVATNDMLIALLSDEDLIGERFLTMDQVLSVGWRNVGIGALVALVLIIWGGVMHRAPRTPDDGGTSE
ncbi:hypothetical protein [Gymnodinialimonas sp.]